MWLKYDKKSFCLCCFASGSTFRFRMIGSSYFSTRYIVDWGEIFHLLVMLLAWLIDLFLVNIIYTNVLFTEEQEYFAWAFLCCYFLLSHFLFKYILFCICRNAVWSLQTMDLCHQMHPRGVLLHLTPRAS